MKIGARVLKTGLAISLSIMLSILLLPNSKGVFAGIAAITTTMPSVRKSYEMLIKRFNANFIGGVVAVIALYTIGPGPVTTGIAAIITIAILNYLKLADVLTLSVITVVAVMVNDSNIYYITALTRVFDTLIGVVVSFAVNWLIYPPHYDEKFYENLTTTTAEILTLIRAELRNNISFTILNQDLIKARKSLKESRTLFDLIRGEMIPRKANRQVIARKYVVYKHMVLATEQAVKLTDAFHKYDHVFKNFDQDLRLLIRERVETLLTAHEQILMKFEGRIYVDQVNFMTTSRDYRKNYISHFFQQALVELDIEDTSQIDVNGIIHIMSAIYTYEEEIHTLNRLIKSYLHRYNISNGVIEKPHDGITNV